MVAEKEEVKQTEEDGKKEEKKEKEEKKIKCRGTIFQYNPDAILFEFQDGEDEAIGVIKPEELLLNDAGVRIPPESRKRAESIGNYINIGDELDCAVTANAELKKFVYTEEEEEVTESGDVRTSTQEVEIQPQWYAKEAKLVVRKKREGLDNDEIGAIEGQLDDIFEGSEEKKKFKKPAPKEKKKAKVPEMVKAKIMQLKKPLVGRMKSKIASGYVEILEGKYAGKRQLIHNNKIFIWGHQLSRADLNYHIKGGDEFTLEVVEGDEPESVNVLKAFLGPVGTKPVQAAEDKDFAVWLTERSLDYPSFRKWLSDELLRKPYFPLASEVCEAEVLSLFKQQDDRQENSGGVVRVVSEGIFKDCLAVFDREDFYIGSVQVGKADLRVFLRIKDKVKCQVQDVNSSEKRFFRKCVGEDVDFNHLANLVFIGEKRPKSANLRPVESLELKAYLGEMGLTLPEFEDMRMPKAKEEKTAEGGNTSSSSAPPPLIQQPPPPFVSQPMYPGFVPYAGPNMVPNQLQKNTNTAMAASLATRTMLLTGNHDPRIDRLFEHEKDITNAIFLSKTLTMALIKKMQANIKNKIRGNQFGDMNVVSLNAQLMQIKATESQFASQEIRDYTVKGKNETADQHLMRVQIQTMESKMRAMKDELDRSKWKATPGTVADMSQQLAVVEAKLKAEEELKKQGTLEKKKETSVKKMKNMLQAYKATKTGVVANPPIVTNPPIVSQPAYPVKLPEPQIAAAFVQEEPEPEPVNSEDDKILRPIELLRKFHIKKYNIRIQGEDIWFGSISYPKATRTNFMISKSADLEADYYTLHTLYYFLQYVERDHTVYIRRAMGDNVPTVRRPDRADLISYLTGEKGYVNNLTQKTHQELNPPKREPSVEYGGTSTRREDDRKSRDRRDDERRSSDRRDDDRRRSRDKDRSSRRRRSRSRSRSRDRDSRRRNRSRDRSPSPKRKSIDPWARPEDKSSSKSPPKDYDYRRDSGRSEYGSSSMPNPYGQPAAPTFQLGTLPKPTPSSTLPSPFEARTSNTQYGGGQTSGFDAWEQKRSQQQQQPAVTSQIPVYGGGGSSEYGSASQFESARSRSRSNEPERRYDAYSGSAFESTRREQQPDIRSALTAKASNTYDPLNPTESSPPPSPKKPEPSNRWGETDSGSDRGNWMSGGVGVGGGYGESNPSSAYSFSQPQRSSQPAPVQGFSSSFSFSERRDAEAPPPSAWGGGGVGGQQGNDPSGGAGGFQSGMGAPRKSIYQPQNPF